jgi:hypothetical protein
LSIADFRLPIEEPIDAIPQSEIGNRQSAIL